MVEMIGKTTLECAKHIIGQNNEVAGIFVRQYNYVPNEVSKDEPNPFLEREYFLNTFDPNKMLIGLPEGTNIALDSNIKLRGGKDAFWPMVDMAPSKSDINLEKIEKRVSGLLSPYTGTSYLLETNRSYHLLGNNILRSQKEWYDFLGTCLISSIVTKTPDGQPNIHEVIVDYRYIGHSILRGSSGLRLTTSGSKDFEPKVISVV